MQELRRGLIMVTHGTVDILNSTITRTGISILNSASFDYCFAGRCTSTASAGPDRTICEGSSATLNGSGGGTYSWSPSYGLSNPNIANPVASPAVTTTYTLTVTNGLCVSTDVVLVTVNPDPAVDLGYAFKKSIVIDHNKVSGGSDLLNFPVLVNISSSPERDQLRTFVNGGHVQNSNGYDIIFTDANNNKLDHQVESYDPVTGNLIAWVRLPVLSASVNTTIRMLYGNPQISTDPSVKSVWDPNFRGVWHLNTIDYSDGTLNGNNGTNFGSADAAGQIGYGKSFNGTTSYIDAGNNSSLFINNSITVSAWVKCNSAPSGHIVNMGGGWSDPGYSLFWLDATGIRVELQGATKSIHDIPLPSFGSWHYIATTWNIISKTINTYIDGILVAGGGDLTFNGPIGNPAQHLEIGKDANQAGYIFNGIIDEPRVQSISRPAGWIATEYNNQKTPSGFYNISGESNCSAYDFEVCANATGVIYSVPVQANQTYNWSITGASGFTGNGTNQVSVNWGAAGTGQISLSVTNTITGCTASSPVYSVIKDPVPAPVINGNLTVCPEKSNEIYNTANIVGHSYVWTVTGDVSFTGVGTNQINVDWGPGPIGTVSLVETIIATGCNTSANITVNILDSTPPDITCPGVIVQNVDGGTCNASVVVPDAVITDNCSLSSLTWTMTGATVASSSGSGINQVGTYTFNAGITTVTYTVKDATGNQGTCNFTITITDNINPAITCPANITHTADPGQCSYTVAVGVPTTGDNCGVSGTVGTRSDALLLTAPYPVGVTTIHWVVTDIHGNINSCDQTVTVTDNEIPAITCPGNVTHTADPGQCSYTVAVGIPTTGDNCGVSGTVGTRSDALLLTAPYPVGVTTIHWVVTDIHGNTNSCDQTVTVTDNEIPAITCPSNITHTADAGLCSYNVAVGVPTTGDNCGVSGTVGTRSDALLLTDPYPVGATTIHWVVTDIHGNTNSCNQTVTVTDNEIPAITCPANITHTADAGLCSYTVVVGVPTTGDNCGVSGTVGTRSDALLLTDPYPVGITTIHWVATDIHGNINSCDQTVTVTDNEIPAITCPANINHTADAGLCSYTVAVGVPTTGDNCGVSGTVGTRSDALLLTAPYPVGITTIHWVVTDIHGNINSCDQTVTVTDNEIPTIACPANINHTADAGLCSYTVAVGVPTTGDNCGVSGTVGTRSDALLLTAPYPVGITTIHWVVTDIHGNINSCDQTVTVTDNEIPTITCPANITHTADAGLCSYTVAVGVPTTGDNCGVSGTVGTRSDALLLTDPYPVGVTTIHWVVTDIHGNINSCDQTVTVTDDEIPAIACPANITHTADAGLCSYTVAVGVPTTGDNCGVSGTVGTRSDALLLTAPYPVGVTTIHWVVTDIHGNSNSCDQTVTVMIMRYRQ